MCNQAESRTAEYAECTYAPDPVAEAAVPPGRVSWHHQRHQYVREFLRTVTARRVVDLGCHDGELLSSLAQEPQIAEVVGIDICPVSLRAARNRLNELPRRLRTRAHVIHGTLLQADESRVKGFDAGICLEVIEHINREDHPAFEQLVFGNAGLPLIVLTTPNREYNCRFNLAEGQWRHRDHRFEWNRAEFRAWAERVAARYGYGVSYIHIGNLDPDLGAPTQGAIFTRAVPQP